MSIQIGVWPQPLGECLEMLVVERVGEQGAPTFIEPPVSRDLDAAMDGRGAH